MPIKASLRDLLRQRTAAAHDALEITPLMQVISGGAPTVGEYQDFLEGHLSMHAPLEAALLAWLPKDWCELRLVKAHWLRDDLQALGCVAPPAPAHAPDITSQAQAMGILYVLEGGTLGLQVVRKRMQTDHPACTAASRFMVGYGSETGRNWLAFLDRLERLPTQTWPQALDAACATFAAFHRQFRSTKP